MPMKRSTQCVREYDNSMMFCLDDGAELLYVPGSTDEPATAILSEPRAVAAGFNDGETPSRAQVSTTGGAPVVKLAITLAPSAVSAMTVSGTTGGNQKGRH